MCWNGPPITCDLVLGLSQTEQNGMDLGFFNTNCIHLDVQNVNTEVLFNTDISNFLYTGMSTLYSTNTVRGKLCR